MMRGRDAAFPARNLNQGIRTMAWRCELTGKNRQIGHKVSHSNRKTKRQFKPNLLNVTMISEALGRKVRLRISANALKTVDHRGGLDAFLLKAKNVELSPRVLELKRQVVKKRTAAAAQKPQPYRHFQCGVRVGARRSGGRRSCAFKGGGGAGRARSSVPFSSNSSASFSVITPPSSS